MATVTKNTPGVRKKAGNPDANSIVVNQINIRNVNRNRKDINTWRQAHKTAESIHNPNRSALYDLYDDVMLDGHLTGIIEKRDAAVINKKLIYKDAGGGKVDSMDALINTNNFRKILKTIMETPRWGISGLEFLPGPELRFKEIPRKHIKPHLRIIAKEQEGTTGTPYDANSNLWVIGDEKDLGLLLKCTPYTLWKRGLWGDWSQYVEIFGQPVRIMKYDTYDKRVKLELKEVLDESGSSLALMIPKGVDFDLKDGKASNGDGKLQDTLKNALNAEMSILILGNTETTSSSASSGHAQSDIHQQQQLEITKSDLIFTANLLNDPQFIRILKSYGWPLVDGGMFEHAQDVDPEAVKAKLENIKMLRDMGTPVDDDYAYEISGIPKPKNYEALKAEQRERQRAKLQEDPDTDPEPKETSPPSRKKQVENVFDFFGMPGRKPGK